MFLPAVFASMFADKASKHVWGNAPSFTKSAIKSVGLSGFSTSVMLVIRRLLVFLYKTDHD